MIMATKKAIVEINLSTLKSNNAELLLLEIKDYLEENKHDVITQILLDVQEIKNFLVL